MALPVACGEMAFRGDALEPVIKQRGSYAGAWNCRLMKSHRRSSACSMGSAQPVSAGDADLRQLNATEQTRLTG